MPDYQQRFGDLLKDQRDVVVADVLRMEPILVPRFTTVSRESRETMIAALVVGIEHVVRGGFPEQLVGLAEDAIALRLKEGFTREELCLATHAFLAAVRRLCTSQLGAEAGLACFEQVEPRMLLGLKAVHEAVARAAARRR